jgi:hypothetical protein
MPPKKNKEQPNAERLAKNIRANQKSAGPRRARKDSIRAKSGGDTRRALGNERELPPLARLMGAFREEKIRFQVIGMSAAIIQGVPGSTNDVDLWIDLPARQYMRPVNIALGLGAEFVRNTVVSLPDHTLINFVYEVTGLGSFATEFRKSRKIPFHETMVHVLPLQSIRKSKQAIGRPKDLIHINQIEECLKCQKADAK